MKLKENEFYCVQLNKKVRVHADDICVKTFRNKKRKGGVPALEGYCKQTDSLIYKFIREQAKENKKKVIVFAEDVAASGGYLISCAGDEIYANQSSIIGSIGVIFSSFGFKDLIKKLE